MKTEAVSEAISDIAKTLRHYADQIDRDGETFVKRRDPEYIGIVLCTVTNMMGNLRLERLVSRLVREFTAREFTTGE